MQTTKLTKQDLDTFLNTHGFLIISDGEIINEELSIEVEVLSSGDTIAAFFIARIKQDLGSIRGRMSKPLRTREELYSEFIAWESEWNREQLMKRMKG